MCIHTMIESSATIVSRMNACLSHNVLFLSSEY